MVLVGRLAIPDRRLLEIDGNAPALIVNIAKREFTRRALLVSRGPIPFERHLKIFLATVPPAVHVAENRLRLGVASFRRGRYPAKGSIDIRLNACPMREYKLMNIRCLLAQPNGRRLTPCFRPILTERRFVPIKKDQAELELRFDIAKLRCTLVPDDGIGHAPDDTLASRVKRPYPIARLGVTGL